jgi:hypothetical protein
MNKIFHSAVYSMSTFNCNTCYNYKPYIFNPTCYPTTTCNVDLISTTSGVPCGLSSQTLLNTQLQTYLECNASTITGESYQDNIVNQGIISTTIYSEFLNYGQNRFNKYIRWQPPVIPQSVIDLQMQTANVGVPRTIVEPCSGR